MPPKCKPIDWEAVEREYRAGQISVKEIARANQITDTAIHKRARAYGWVRALADKVRANVREKLIRADGLRSGVQDSLQSGLRPQPAPDEELVETASLRGLQVITSHRRDIEQLNTLKRIILARLEEHLTTDSPGGPFAGSKETPGDLVDKLSRVTARLIPLERQAYNLDEGITGGGVKIYINGDEASL
jgi:hypothetical protein